MKIFLTGVSAELFGKKEIETDQDLKNVAGVKKFLLSEQPSLSRSFTHIAVNSELADDKKKLTAEDRILAFHPYGGG